MMRWTGVLLVSASLLHAGCAAPATAPAAGAAGAAAAPTGMTLPQFLGLCYVVDAGKQVVGHVHNALGAHYPGMEPVPPMVAITDPANMSDKAPPAVKAAAEIKAEEDKASQKIKAIRYLTSVGCGKCRPGAEEALLAALDDCTEAVRYETVKGLRDAAGNPCVACKVNSCCSQKILQKLEKMGRGSDDQGCPAEPSARVRRLARLAMTECGGGVPEIVESTPQEGPSAKSVPKKEPTPAKEGPADKKTDSAEEPATAPEEVPAG